MAGILQEKATIILVGMHMNSKNFPYFFWFFLSEQSTQVSVKQLALRPL